MSIVCYTLPHQFFFEGEKLQKSAEYTGTARTPGSCVERLESFSRTPREIGGCAACAWTSARPPHREWNEI